MLSRFGTNRNVAVLGAVLSLVLLQSLPPGDGAASGKFAQQKSKLGLEIDNYFSYIYLATFTTADSNLLLLVPKYFLSIMNVLTGLL